MSQMYATREVSWGEGLVVAAFRHDGGLKVAVDRIHRALGAQVGTRNTFAKLLRTADPRHLGERDQFRAWLLLTAFGEEPAEWGIADSVVPPGFEIARLRESVRHQGLEPRTRWLTVSDAERTAS